MNKGFSLIELMVVIAIVALLAAVAVPAYNNYIIKAKIGAGASALSGVVSRMQQLYDKNGYFPTLEELGFVSDSGSSFAPNAIQNPTLLVPDATTVLINGGQTGIPCSSGFMEAGSVAIMMPDGDEIAVAGYYVTAKSNENIIKSFCLNWRSPTGVASDPEAVFNVYLNCTLPNGNPSTFDNLSDYFASC